MFIIELVNLEYIIDNRHVPSKRVDKYAFPILPHTRQ